MSQRIRKIVGTALLVMFVPLYALVVAAAGGSRIDGAPVAVQLVFYAFFGLAWIVPAGLIIRWMIPRRARSSRS